MSNSSESKQRRVRRAAGTPEQPADRQHQEKLDPTQPHTATTDGSNVSQAADKVQPAEARDGTTVAFVDELGVQELKDVLHGHKGRIFSAAGRESPIAEFVSDGVLLRPAQHPYSDQPPAEELVFRSDDRGILLDELGQPRKILGAKFQGHEIFTLAETVPGTTKHYVGWFDDQGGCRKLYFDDDPLSTADIVIRIRKLTLDGEISIIPNITSD